MEYSNGYFTTSDFRKIVETIQAEGGVYVADHIWIQRLQQICEKYDILLICDEIQVGCCRTGNYFSFERANIIPDIVLLSKSISGLGLPMSIAVYKKELDVWKLGEHNRTFRGNQLAFVGAAAALDYINDFNIYGQVKKKEQIITEQAVFGLPAYMLSHQYQPVTVFYHCL